MNNPLVYLFCMCGVSREIENQCAACPKFCQPAAGISLLTKATPISSEQQLQQSERKAMREQEPTLLYFLGHHDI